MIATMTTPKAIVGDFALMKVVGTSRVGAFLDWGLRKDLLVPFREQREEMVVGREYLVYVYVDKTTDRIVAVSYTHLMATSAEEKNKIFKITDFCQRFSYRDSVPDPYYGGDSGFELVLDLLEDAVEGLLDQLENK